MNLNLPDLSVVSRLFGGLASELRQKKLWPVIALLVVAVGAVPFLLKKSSHPVPVAQTPVATPPPNPATSLPALNVQSTPAHSRLTGRAHNPFGNPAGSSTTGSTTSSTTSSTASVTSSAAGTVSTAAGNAVSTFSGGAGTTPRVTALSFPSTGVSAPIAIPGGTGTNAPAITPNAQPKPVPSGLKPTQAYDVSMAITNSAGGLDTVDPLKRLSVIPSDQQPLLVELGVARDGKHVLFAVQHGAVPSGPGTCIPGPVDCEILSLRRGQNEQLSAQTGSIAPSQVALFAVTGITARNYPSVAAAVKARRVQSAAGRALLDASTYPTLALFRYESSRGYVVDLRSLGVS